MNAALTARIAEDYARAAPLRGSAADGRRRAALAALTRAGLPSSRDENWKYTNLRALERRRFDPPAAAAAPQALAGLPAPIADFSRYVFVDGRFAPELSCASREAFADLASAPEAAGGPSAERSTEQRFALLNDAFATDGALLRVGAGHPQRLELVFVASVAEEAGASYPRLEVQLAPEAQLQLIERHVSATAAGSFVNSALEVQLARGARLTHYRLQALSEKSTLFDTLSASLATRAAYQLHAVSTGARAARSTQSVQLAGEHAELDMATVALGNLQQVQDAFALVEHRAPRARTRQLFRGIAAGRARVAFNGKIVVAPGAVGTDSQQSLRGLLAGPDAEIDVRPQLEIYTDDVRCSHGATAGKLDENMLFYLLSRGLEPDTAQRLLKWAFLADAFARIEVPQLRHQIEEHLAQVLKDRTLQELL
ncbi:MAG TPA: Fe-S cluster assembly protein SufD [Steroidobacteraceae bacterium]|jgi:Fe-S cluster assembly protein SufD